jgi:uncharacterized membrane protein YesL
MLKKFNQLSFVIGLFFLLTAIILLANMLFTHLSDKLTVWSSVAFLAFGLLMIYISGKES